MKPIAQRAHEALAVAHDVPSPCISVCRMDAGSGWCEGCWRTLAEIADWSRMDDARKRAVWEQLPRRAQGARS